MPGLSPSPAVSSRNVAQGSYRFLADASSLLASSLDYEVTLAQVARLVVPRLADWAVVDAQEDDGSIRLLTAAHVNTAKEPLIYELRARYPTHPLAPHGLAKVLRTGEPALYPEIRKTWKEAAARDAKHLELITGLGAVSSLCVPLVARGRTLGALTLVAAESRRRFDQETLDLAMELAYRCALALDNARLVQDLQEAVAARETFLASASHDLKSPITAILGYAQLVQRQSTELSDPLAVQRFSDLAEHVMTTVRHMTGILDELIDVSRLAQGERLPIRRQSMDLAALARDVVEEQQARTSRHSIQLESPEEEVRGDWDPDKLRRVIVNLVGNAVKYSPDGGPIAVRVHPGRDVGENRVVLSVRDHGIGIPESERAHVFEQFHRADNVGRVAGSGIGLASARAIVEEHGGRIAIDSEERVGTTVRIVLPRFPDASPPA